ncbi:flagellar biosynthesis anti-sigma factor FlgM [Chrysiogenes arsenatis]|uniref:flagellar biosynthesis anti-sigma factor FlgM n=1 Tax=Chrysiogenes arsenatis TaxID=309797 RepID=UPI00040E5948|nr:flagellar biosynthesis anti-sigma factor FlgM [Chrysiogenes arsenatis]
MKISGFGGPAIDAYLKNNRADKNKSGNGRTGDVAAAESKGDKVQLSGTSFEAMRAAKIASEAPETRGERIKEIKQAIERGEYRIDLENLASKLANIIR